MAKHARYPAGNGELDAGAGLAALQRSAPPARRAVISPLLANIYLDPLDRLMAERGYRVRVAHGFAMTCGMQTTL